MAAKHRLLIAQILIALFFVTGFVATELGSRGAIRNSWFQHELYADLSRVPAFFTDLKFRLRGTAAPTNRIVIVEIDDDSIRRLGRWPWPRDRTAYLIERIFEQKPRAVGLDMILSEQDERIPDELVETLKAKGFGDLLKSYEPDHELARVVSRYRDRLVLGWASDSLCQPAFGDCSASGVVRLAEVPADFARFAFPMVSRDPAFDPRFTPAPTAGALLPPVPEILAAAEHLGSVNVSTERDGYIRKTPLAVFVNGAPHPSMPLEVARVGLHERLSIHLNGSDGIDSIRLTKAGRDLPISPLGAAQVNFRGPARTFAYVSATDVLQTPDDGDANRRALNDAYVLVGVSALAAGDVRAFPFDSEVPGVEGQATILDNILSGDLMDAGGRYSALILLLFMTIGAFAVFRAASRREAIPAITIFLVSGLGLAAIDEGVLFRNGHNWNTSFMYLELSTMLVWLLGARYISEERGRKFLKLAFSRYVSPDVVDSIVKDPSQLRLGGEKKNLTVMFSDIRGFTTFSEKMDAKALAELLNDYLGIMTDLVFKHQGTLDKYIGDAVMAFWGAPLDLDSHAANACESAREMMAELEVHRGRWLERYRVDVQIGVGINTAPVNVGNMGSERSFGYTVIGDGVNLASRLEGATKAYGVGILTTRDTIEDIRRSGRALPPHRVLDELKVKGKKKAVEIVQVLTAETETDPEGLKEFQQGRSAYRERRWDDAIEHFEHAARLLAKTMPDGRDRQDGPSRVFLHRCNVFKSEPPDPDWDGSWEMDSK